MKRSLAIVFSTLLALGAASTAFADGTTPAQAPQASAAPAAPAAKQATKVQKVKHTARKTRRVRKTSNKAATATGTGGKK